MPGYSALVTRAGNAGQEPVQATALDVIDQDGNSSDAQRFRKKLCDLRFLRVMEK